MLFAAFREPVYFEGTGDKAQSAVGISEVTDCLTVVVSEETGGITVTKNGELHRDLSLEQLQEMLEAELNYTQKTKEPSSSKWNWRVRKHG